MLARDPVPVRTNPAVAAALAVALVGAATIAGAWYFELVLGLAPCPLCLQQRIFYYAAIPLALLVAVAASRGAPRALIVAGLAALALAMLTGAGLAAYHAGIEWRWWPGPQDCSGPIAPLGARGLLQQLESINLVRCDETSWRFLGLSLAGYNVLISALLAAVALWGIAAMRVVPGRREAASPESRSAVP
jgi:disulfide bond formation protein DsbB